MNIQISNCVHTTMATLLEPSNWPHDVAIMSKYAAEEHQHELERSRHGTKKSLNQICRISAPETGAKIEYNLPKRRETKRCIGAEAEAKQRVRAMREE